MEASSFWMSLTVAVHVLLGSVGLAGGALALWATKGSRLHERAGHVFAWSMLAVATTSLVMMLREFLPLAVVLAAAELYLVPSALLALRRRERGGTRRAQVLLALLVGLIALACVAQLVRLSLAAGAVQPGPLAMALVFSTLFVQDLRLLRRPPTAATAWIRRHLTRMILAFVVGVMALVRIGVRFGLSFELTVVLPLVAGVLAILWVQRRYPDPPRGQAAAADRPAAEPVALAGQPMQRSAVGS